MTALRRETLSQIAESVARSMATGEGQSGSAIIQTPMLYPSGSSIVIVIDEVGTSYFVSDLGMGLQEAEMLGAPRTYRSNALAIAANAGIQFDHHAFFVASVSRDQLVGAVTAIANSSFEAIVLTAHKIAEDNADDAIEKLQLRLVGLFSEAAVDRNADIVGASATRWRVAASVQTGGHTSLFDVVAAHPNSIAAAVTKFGDIAELAMPPRRVAVVRDRAKLGTRLTVLQRTADVIEISSPDRAIRQLAEAA